MGSKAYNRAYLYLFPLDTLPKAPASLPKANWSMFAKNINEALMPSAPLSIINHYNYIPGREIENPIYLWSILSVDFKEPITKIFKAENTAKEGFEWALPWLQSRWQKLNPWDQIAILAALEHLEAYISKDFDFESENAFAKATEASIGTKRYFIQYRPADFQVTKTTFNLTKAVPNRYRPFRKAEAWVFRRVRDGVSPKIILQYIRRLQKSLSKPADGLQIAKYVANNKTQYVMEVRKGKLNGRYQTFNPDGTAIDSGLMQNNVPQGRWRIREKEYCEFKDGFIQGVKTAAINETEKTPEYQYDPQNNQKRKYTYITKNQQGQVIIYEDTEIWSPTKNAWIAADGQKVVKYISGKIYQKYTIKDGVYEGIFETYSPEGQMVSKYNYVNGAQEGIQETYGISTGKIETRKEIGKNAEVIAETTFAASGKILSETKYEQKNIVLHKAYRANGKLRLVARYDADSTVVTYYNNKDQLEETNVYKKDNKCTVYGYYSSGKIAYIAIRLTETIKPTVAALYRQTDNADVEDGGSDILKVYGIAKGLESVEDGIRVKAPFEGEFLKYYENGKLLARYDFKDGLPEGECIVFNPDGTMRQRLSYKNGGLMAISPLSLPDGKTLVSGDLKEGNGTVQFYDLNNRIYKRGAYKEGRPVGIWEFWENGQALGSGYYQGRYVRSIETALDKWAEILSLGIPDTREIQGARATYEAELKKKPMNLPALRLRALTNLRTGKWQMAKNDLLLLSRIDSSDMSLALRAETELIYGNAGEGLKLLVAATNQIFKNENRFRAALRGTAGILARGWAAAGYETLAVKLLAVERNRSQRNDVLRDPIMRRLVFHPLGVELLTFGPNADENSKFITVGNFTGEETRQPLMKNKVEITFEQVKTEFEIPTAPTFIGTDPQTALRNGRLQLYRNNFYTAAVELDRAYVGKVSDSIETCALFAQAALRLKMKHEAIPTLEAIQRQMPFPPENSTTGYLAYIMAENFALLGDTNKVCEFLNKPESKWQMPIEVVAVDPLMQFLSLRDQGTAGLSATCQKLNAGKPVVIRPAVIPPDLKIIVNMTPQPDKKIIKDEKEETEEKELINEDDIADDSLEELDSYYAPNSGNEDFEDPVEK
jgi:antitoxin component YwqK of YwqJK toxin-antitoxin module